MIRTRKQSFDNSLETLSIGLVASEAAQNRIGEARIHEDSINLLLGQLSTSAENVIVVDFQARHVLEKNTLTDQPRELTSTSAHNPALRVYTEDRSAEHDFAS